MDLNIEKFEPTKAQLMQVAEEASSITAQSKPAEVKEMRLRLQKTRTAIMRIGKALREEAILFQREVIAKEKELVAIITPEEDRLQAIEDETERTRIRTARIELLPQRKERLAAIGDGLTETDDHLLDMDGPSFENYINQRVADKNEADRLKLAADQRRIEDEKAEIQRRKDLADAEERGRREASEKAERESKEREEREQREREESTERERQEKERLEREETYQAFLKQHGYSSDAKDQFHVERTEHEVKLYKLVGVLQINQPSQS